MNRRIAVALCAIAYGLSSSACATPATCDRWRAYDRVEEISFSADSPQGSPVAIHWRVQAEGPVYSRGTVTAALTHSSCEAVQVVFDGEPLPPSESEQWPSLRLDRRPIARIETTTPPAVAPCTIALQVEDWSREADPQITLEEAGRSLGEFQATPPRRNGWLVAVPFAVVADGVLVVVTLGTVTLLDDPPSVTWSPGSKPEVDED